MRVLKGQHLPAAAASSGSNRKLSWSVLSFAHLPTCSNRQQRSRAPLHVVAATIDKPKESDGGTSVIDRPGLDLSQIPVSQRTDSGFGSADTSQNKFTGGGNYRVVLLDSPNHTEKLVVQVITTVVGSDENHAKNCFATSRKLGQAMVTSCLKEHAEFYVEQIKRQGVAVKMEPDTTTL